AKLGDGEAGYRIAPVGGDGVQGIQHKGAVTKGRGRDGEVRLDHRATGPEQQIEIECARSPAAVTAAVEAALYRLEEGEHGERLQRRGDQRGGVGVGAQRGAERTGRDDRGARYQTERRFIERRERRLDDGAW